MVLLFALLTTVFVVVLKHGRLGRLLRAMSASPTGLATSGTSVNVTRVLIFCLAAFLAAVSGALAGSAVGEVSATSYPAFDSVLFFALIMISVGGEPWYAVLAAASVTIVPSYVQGTNVTNYLTLLFGIGRDFVRDRPVREASRFRSGDGSTPHSAGNCSSRPLHPMRSTGLPA